jgi:hypothetical protein
MPKIKRKEDDKGSQDRQSEQPSNKPPRNTQKASGPESAIQLPRINRCSAEQGNAGKMGSSASIQNAAKAAIRDWHEEEEAVNSYIQAIRDKVRGDTNVMVLYGNGSFPALVKG